MHELIPGMLLALREDRHDDAVQLARVMLDELDNPTSALLQVAIAANFLHRHPEMPLAQFAIMMREDELDDPRTLGHLSHEFLGVVEEMMAGEEEDLSDESRQILETYNMRPGSAEVVQQFARLTAALVTDLQLRLSLRSQSPNDAAAMVEQAFTAVRAELGDEQTR